jgi:putative ABC transport system permease protein
MESLSGITTIVFRGPRLIPWAIALQLGMAILVPLLAALIPVLQGSRISVQEALSGIRQKSSTEPGRLAEQLAKIRRIPRPLIISIRNTFRQRARVILTLITLSLGGAIFIAAFNVQVSMTDQVEQISKYFLGDVNLTLARPYRIARVEEALADVSGIRTIEPWGAGGGELVRPDGTAGDNVQILAPPAGSQLVEPKLLEGRWLLPGDRNAIAVNERFMQVFPDLEPGDTITLRINQDDTSWVVVGIFQLVGNSGGFVTYANYEYLSELTHQANQAAVFRIVAENPNLTLAEQEVLGRQLETALDANGINVREITPGKSLSGMASDGFSILTTFLLFMAVLTAIVGSIGLTGAMSMNILERTREIGIMRAIGATNKILLRLVIVEGMLVGMLSWVIGSLLAFPISKALGDAISIAIFGSQSTLGINVNGYAIWLAAVFVLSLFASVLPARNAARLTIREVLAYE